MIFRLTVLLIVVPVLGGCFGTSGTNAGFDLSIADARADLRRMAEEPVTLERPVVVAAGLADPGLNAAETARRLREATGDDRIIVVDFFWCGSFDSCAETLTREITRAFPIEEAGRTVEVDVVAISMGGLVARHAATERDGKRRLAVRRLMTLATPHRGADLAWMALWDSRVRGMMPNSSRLRALDAELESDTYELVCYARLGDTIVGTANAAPEGHELWWVSTPPMQMAHMDVFKDPRLLADIARRLRGETAFTGERSAPLPGRETVH